jgi:hypothetical protein
MGYFEKTGGKGRLEFTYGGCYATFVGKNPYGNTQKGAKSSSAPELSQEIIPAEYWASAKGRRRPEV